MARVLVCESDADGRELLTMAIELAGFDVIAAPTPVEACARALLERVDVVLVEHGFRTPAAHAVLRVLRANPRTRKIPVAVMTTNTHALPELQAAGFAFVVVKPFNPFVVTDRLWQVILRRAASSRPDSAA